MKFDTSVDCNSIVLLSAPRQDEIGQSSRISEDLKIITVKYGMNFECFLINTKNELIDYLRQLHSSIENGLRPILHFDAHGNKDHGILIGNTNEFVSWNDITSELRKLNAASGNQLFVFIASCYGIYTLKSVTIYDSTPFYIMFGPSNAVTIEEIENIIPNFYKVLFEYNNIEESIKSLNCKFEYFHAERLFCKVMIQYFRDHCLGNGGRKRRENLLSGAMNKKGVENTKQNRILFRKVIKKDIKPSPEFVDQYATVFLHGKKCSISSIEIISMAKKAARKL